MVDDHNSKAELLAKISCLEARVKELDNWKKQHEERQQKARDCERRLELLADAAGDALYQLRYHSMTYDYLSPGIKSLTGYTPEEINQIGFANLVREIQHPDGSQLDKNDLMWQRMEGQTGEFYADYLVEAKSGEKVWLGDHSFPWLDDKGMVLGSLGILIDITSRKNLENKLRRRATTDFLTGASTRRHYINLVSREISRSLRSGSPLCLIIMDVDHFKLVNDTYGHAAGDNVLKHLCDLCRSQLRVSDSLGRIGGEEFGILLVDCPLKKALQVAERLKELIADSVLLYSGEPISCTASFGVAQLNPSTDNLELLMKRADAALYEAKGKGRNLVWADWDLGGASLG
ncbi:sensor domain-containing diguanylate cyclase [Dethiosulfatarculus sandiegensis]|uniref:sensor domain-containing diguanylate cyclase n=1 Tax=Dethiosulfatarculus sandiegensis TaxID=1429043 RepID=UPI0006962D52|nr:sensor domain-containing diguanylate cyclase [Dethiosulfatarculus sandiegensis]